MAKKQYEDDDYEEIEDIEEEEEVIDRGDDFEPDEEDVEDSDSDEEIEDEEEDDNEDEDEEEDEEPSNIRIPKSRFDEVIAQREQERERNQWLESQLERLIEQRTAPPKEEEKAPEYDFDTSERKYVELLLEGETDQAARLRQEINKAQQEQITFLINQTKQSATTEAIDASIAKLDQTKFDELVDNYENKYPFLDSSSEEYDEEAVSIVNSLLQGHIASGLTKSSALTKAVNSVTKMLGKTSTPKKSLGSTLRNSKKKLIASRRQPQKMRRSSSNTNRNINSTDVARMSEKEFNSLTEREKRIARGDIVG